jgi:hypothetical protein
MPFAESLCKDGRRIPPASRLGYVGLLTAGEQYTHNLVARVPRKIELQGETRFERQAVHDVCPGTNRWRHGLGLRHAVPLADEAEAWRRTRRDY